MSLTLNLELRQEQRLELRLAQELQLQLQQQLLQRFQEFGPYIQIDDDLDFPLLQRSLPFLALHEFGHVLEHRGRVSIPPFPAEAERSGIGDMSSVIQNYTETAVDRCAYLLGTTACNYSPERMAVSHCALLERVFRDTLRTEKFPVSLPFLARAVASLREYKTKDSGEGVWAQAHDLEGQASGYFAQSERTEEFERVAQLYGKVLRTTAIVEKASAPGSASGKGGYLRIVVGEELILPK